MNYYDYINVNKLSFGCTNCPFAEQCDQGAGYTQMDEHGTCPIDNIETEKDKTLLKIHLL